MKNKQELELMLSNLKYQSKILSEKIEKCPQGVINMENRRGKIVPVLVQKENGRIHRKNLDDDPETVSRILEGNVLRQERKTVLANISVLEKAVAAYELFNPAEAVFSLKQKYPKLDMERIFTDGYSEDDLEWMNEDYCTADYMTEQKRHRTSRGLAVRSKSELLIAEKLYEYGIPMRYEQTIFIGNMTLIPDFTIRRRDGKLFYWEHEGLTSAESYVEWQRKKAELYASVKIVPWNNLIVTYDNEDGVIDLRIVESEIRNKLLL